MKEITPRPGEPRLSYLARVAAAFIQEYSLELPLRYDGVDSDGNCLATDLENAVENVEDLAKESQAAKDLPEPPFPWPSHYAQPPESLAGLEPLVNAWKCGYAEGFHKGDKACPYDAGTMAFQSWQCGYLAGLNAVPF